MTSRFFEDSYLERNTVSSVMMKLGATAMLVAAPKVSTRQLGRQGIRLWDPERLRSVS